MLRLGSLQSLLEGCCLSLLGLQLSLYLPHLHQQYQPIKHVFKYKAEFDTDKLNLIDGLPGMRCIW